MLIIVSSGLPDREVTTSRRASRRVRRGAAVRRGRLPRLEPLEVRITPSSTWTGLGGNADWTTANNWSGDIAPQAGDSLSFPSGVTNLTTVDNFSGNMSFSSISIGASGYSLSASSGDSITLTGGISTTYTSGDSTDSIPTALGGSISVGSGGELDLDGALTGSNGLTLTSGGTLGLGGTTANNYSGTTTVDGGTLTLNKTVGVIAVPGPLVIGNDTGSATVKLTAADQTTSATSVTIGNDGTLNLNGNNDAIGALTLSGATVTTGTGILTLGGDVTVTQPTGSGASLISGNLDLGGTAGMFTVSGGTTGTELSVPAVISDSTAGVTVTGGATVDFSGKNTYTGTTTVTNGSTLLVDGTIGPVQVNAGSTLGGSGTVGTINSTGGTIMPGDGGGPLEAGSLTLDANSTFAPVLAGPSSDVTGELVDSGTITLNGALDATLAPGYVPSIGDQITIIHNTGGSAISGNFIGLTQGSTFQIGLYTFEISYQGGSGHDVVLSYVPYTTTTTISTTTTLPASYGDPVDFTAGVTASGGNAPRGTVDFYDGNPAAGGMLLGSESIGSDNEATYSTSALSVTGSPHDIYAVYIGQGQDAGSTTTQPVSVTVDPAVVTASLVGPVTKTYDGTTTATLDAANYQLSGVAGAGSVSLVYPTSGTYGSASAGSGVTVSVGGLSLSGADAGDYTLASSSISGQVGVINPAPLTVTGITATSKPYDGTTSAVISTSGAALEGVIGNDQVTLDTSGAMGTFQNANVGANKTVIVTGLSLTGADASDYAIGSESTTMASITPVLLYVDADPETMVYGSAVPMLGLTAQGLVGSDTVSTALTGSLATTASPTADVGTYPITQGSLAAVNGNYTIDFTGSNVTITPAPLTISAENLTTVYGAPLPSLVPVYKGFVQSDGPFSLATLPSLTTSATPGSAVGSYPITVSGASSNDYTITYVPGTLTVTRAGTSASVSESLSSSVVGQGVTFTAQVSPATAGHPTGTVTFLVDGNPAATVSVNPATGQASFSTSSLSLGTHTVTAEYSGDSNYTGSQAGAIQDTVGADSTTTTITETAIRNKKGRIVKVMIDTQVSAAAPGAGLPTGSVTFFRGVRPIASTNLTDGAAALTLKKSAALKKHFTVRYDGVAEFQASASPTVTVTKKSLATATSARPAAVFLNKHR